MSYHGLGEVALQTDPVRSIEPGETILTTFKLPTVGDIKVTTLTVLAVVSTLAALYSNLIVIPRMAKRIQRRTRT